ncbi:MAG: ferredoxin family protein [Chloroflexi bacterium]|nr:ferredoxin family protein [Chloroflexota bacterium]MCL5075267.1 ferredoxin family protein [Chloroflexota bacterium]
MPPKVNPELCTGCGICIEYCPEDVLRLEDGEVVLKYPEECWQCGVCKLECPEEAIEMVFPLESTLLVAE